MRKRDRTIAAKRRILRELIEHLERDRSMEDADGILGIDALLVEFRRRADVEAPAVPPGHEHLPGLGPVPDRVPFARFPGGHSSCRCDRVPANREVVMATRIPDLIFYCPSCPLCSAETESDGDGFNCENCNLWWAKDGTEGERANSDLPECGAELSPWPDEERLTSLRSARYRCLLDEGHELPHRGVRVDQPDREGDTYDWDDVDEAAAAQSANGTRCPDGGTCHHYCEVACFRVLSCEPLSGVFPDDEWPQDVVAAAQQRRTEA